MGATVTSWSGPLVTTTSGVGSGVGVGVGEAFAVALGPEVADATGSGPCDVQPAASRTATTITNEAAARDMGRNYSIGTRRGVVSARLWTSVRDGPVGCLRSE
ncbi:hypothetical protein GCM10009774_24750 [Cellulomonas gelida]|nr:hypothetical protein GCM10009774_24750 [Cellulomonas gelida]